MKSLIASLFCVLIPISTRGANPDQLAVGQQLFMQEFASTRAGLGGDGLGPVFNDSSCVGCHNVGGVGGSGDVRSNARSLGMREAEFRDPNLMLTRREMKAWEVRNRLGLGDPANSPANQKINSAIAKFSPGFISPNGSIGSSFPIHRRGGSPAFSLLRDQSLSIFNPGWNDDNNASCDTVHAERTPREIVNGDKTLSLSVQVFARNTTSLFGTGLIDQIPETAIWQQAKLQRSDGEISGRPGTLSDGRIGKFGWRADFATLLEFNENACAAELGLQSKRVPQPVDLANRTYVNPNPDLSDEAIQAMNSFVASLPRPAREIPTESSERERISKGEQRFAVVGCAKCHVPNLGYVNDLYSDLLLHDMGPYSIDMAAAPPYIRSIAVMDVVTRASTTDTASRTYYGNSMTMQSSNSVVDTGSRRPFGTSTPSATTSRGVTKLVSPSYPPTVTSEPIAPRVVSTVGSVDSATNEVAGRNANETMPRMSTQTVETQKIRAAQIEQTPFTQEWKTPPLWGVRDSAPYMHDGRAETILEAIAMHDGEARGTRNRFFALSYDDQQAVLAFLDTFVAPTQGVIETPKKFTRRDLVVR